MGNPKVFVASLILVGLVAIVVHADAEVVEAIEVSSSNDGSAKIECGGACAARCALARRQNRCTRACESCCAHCNCVPPGTYGNYDACPCYAKLTTRHNNLKCP
ncbi:GAST1-like protein 3 [Perilla frutescens var. hirtella]|uniref:GAST1-like protein 3 n=1 Tax=Perilla frutescens var. hirtella TaxID=608512 RepID=A0AAD4JD19_PERFH|nr:GAST1-like protein 3 [Perilla frutescens var. hirtella]